MNFSNNIYCFTNPAVLLVLFFFVSEAFFKISLFSIGAEPILLKVSKGFVLLILTAYLLYNKAKQLLLILMLFLLFIIGQKALFVNITTVNLIAFSKLIFPIILLLFFSTFKLTNFQRLQLYKVFEYLLLFNAVIIILGFVFSIYIFKSYTGARFGYNGLFITSATSSYVYCFSLIYLILKYRKAVFKKSTNLIIIFSMFFVGTKVIYFFLFSFFVIYLLKYIRFNKKVGLPLLLLFGCFCMYFAFFKYGIFNDIRQKHGLISSLMSYRDTLFLERTLPFIKEQWSLVNYLFGGVSDLTTKSQMELIDVFYFFGIIGGLLYFFIFFKCFLTFKLNIYIIILLSILFIIVLLAGNFFSYPSVAIYIVILREYLNLNEKNKHT